MEKPPARQAGQSLPDSPTLLDFPALLVDPIVATGKADTAGRNQGTKARPMKTKLMHLAIAAITLAAVPSPGRSQEFFQDSLVQLSSFWNDATSGLISPPMGNRYAEDLSCGDGSCGECNSCCHRLDVFGSVEYLMWWAKGTELPPLVTTSDPADLGVLGRDTTTILFGNEFAGNNMQVGGRATLGIWLDRGHNVAAAGRFFGLGGDTTRFAAASDGSELLARPFFNAFLGIDDALLIAFPGLATGSIAATATTQNIFGVETIFEVMMHREACRRVDLIFGYQFMRLDDSVEIVSNHTLTQSNTLFTISDRFRAENEFHGGEIGLRGRLCRGCWSLDALAQVAIGGIRQQVVIEGQTVITPSGGAPTPFVGGLLAQPSNIGTFERNTFAYIPSFTLNLKYHVNPCLNLFVGYNLMWLSDVALSGDQIDLRVNPNQPLPPPLPEFRFRDRDYWLQGMNFGASFDF
jgi:hypothetical protein